PPLSRAPPAAGDLAAGVLEVAGDGRNAPVALPNSTSLLEEVRELPSGDSLLPLTAGGEQPPPPAGELTLQERDELECLRRQDARIVRREDGDAGGGRF